MTAYTADRRPSLLVWVALATVYVVWGSTYLGIAIAIETLPPMLSGALRFLTAALLLGGFLMIRRGPSVFRMTRRQFGSAARIGAHVVRFCDVGYFDLGPAADFDHLLGSHPRSCFVDVDE